MSRIETVVALVGIIALLVASMMWIMEMTYVLQFEGSFFVIPGLHLVAILSFVIEIRLFFSGRHYFIRALDH